LSCTLVQFWNNAPEFRFLQSSAQRHVIVQETKYEYLMIHKRKIWMSFPLVRSSSWPEILQKNENLIIKFPWITFPVKRSTIWASNGKFETKMDEFFSKLLLVYFIRLKIHILCLKMPNWELDAIRIGFVYYQFDFAFFRKYR